mmetsp:Transcript_18227/g.37271  ORF Transcript_18227/g.37271 Transcript_18227/m.37271 type:complete len:131 (+) Transcript_18227:26-418(+)
MFELLSHAAHLTQATHAGQQLNLVGGSNEVYNSYPTAGAPWTPDYLLRPNDAAGLEAEGGANGPYACDGDGFACSVFNRQAYDSGSIGNGTYDVYTNFGTGAEDTHGLSAAANGGGPCKPWSGVDCNGIS